MKSRPVVENGKKVLNKICVCCNKPKNTYKVRMTKIKSSHTKTIRKYGQNSIGSYIEYKVFRKIEYCRSSCEELLGDSCNSVTNDETGANNSMINEGMFVVFSDVVDDLTRGKL